MKWKILLLLVTGCFLSAAAQATIVYSVSDGVNTTVINPLAKAESAAAYYDYGFSGASGNPDFGPEEDKAFFWLYTDTNTGILSLGMIFDKRCTASCTDGGQMSLTSSGMPGSAFVSVADEEAPAGSFINGSDLWAWNSANTDGGMISGLQNQTWSIDLFFNNFTGLSNGFAFVDGPSPLGASDIDLAISIGSTLTISAVEVPAPVTSGLLLLGLGLLVRRRAG